MKISIIKKSLTARVTSRFRRSLPTSDKKKWMVVYIFFSNKFSRTK